MVGGSKESMLNELWECSCFLYVTCEYVGASMCFLIYDVDFGVCIFTIMIALFFKLYLSIIS